MPGEVPDDRYRANPDGWQFLHVRSGPGLVEPVQETRCAVRAPDVTRSLAGTLQTMGSAEVLREEEIAEVFYGKPHVAILGAGASIAALPAGDANGKQLPDMRGLASLAPVRELLLEAGVNDPAADFEAEYARLRAEGATKIADRIDLEVRKYFSGIELVEQPTIYDHLLLSLRPKDLVATFNWDPLLVQAHHRLVEGGAEHLPHMVFLHGNVAVGACTEHRVQGDLRARCPECSRPLEPVPLLYPVTEKNYEADTFIARAWADLRTHLSDACIVTIFGYSAPVTDVAAIGEFKRAWGGAAEREFEQFELIIRPGADHEEAAETWHEFIFSHHFDVFEDFYESAAAKHPRRSGENYFSRFVAAKFTDENPVPRDLSEAETVAWYRQLWAAEEAARSQRRERTAGT